MSDRLAPDELAAWRGMLRVHAAIVRELDAELQGAHDLPLAHYDVLVQLESAPDGRLRMRELADAVLLSRSGLTRLVDRLERDGLVRREPCPDDARGSFALLTSKGVDRLHEARLTHLDGVRRRFLARLRPDELHALGPLWERLVEP